MSNSWRKRKKRNKRSSFIRRRTPPGTQPGTLIPDPESPQPLYQLVHYNDNEYAEQLQASLEDVLNQNSKESKNADQITWLNVEGLGDVNAIHKIGQSYGLHPLALEDVINVHQRPKLEAYREVLFVVARMPHPEAIPTTEQVAFFLGSNFLLTFQEGTPGDSFDPVRKRLRENSGKLRHSSPAYLLYSLLDALIDQYFPQLEYYADLLENIEDQLIQKVRESFSSELYTIRRNLMQILRSIRPLQDVIAALMRENTQLFDEETRYYLRDCLDHTAQLLDMLETYRDLSTHLMEMAESAADTRLNEIMRFLTVMSSIFIPLSFIAGLYGMNFDSKISPWNMPELGWYFGYPLTLLVMISTVLGMLVFFRHKGWLGIPESERRL